jgi:hypothetical protein
MIYAIFNFACPEDVWRLDPPPFKVAQRRLVPIRVFGCREPGGSNLYFAGGIDYGPSMLLMENAALRSPASNLGLIDPYHFKSANPM